ncbi:cytochrome c [Pseudorhodoplanes sp.]|uniref:c-type cytochrome n=1 Tax=Pseudorhodoplanes sp. TaxID=1934341 RepID=UPI002C5D6375|nr:cytochrome c [Pseudorhodoplanes sp.]HWV52223.1 cytochrome c [Pseudorhodoplanes sp.]
MSRSLKSALAAFAFLSLISVSAPAQDKPQATQAHSAKPVNKLNIGREATAEEIAGWDIDIRPDGHGLPVGKGTVKQGEPLYVERCAACHGEFGESAGRWPILSGGNGSLASHDPVKSIGSYWPYASTIIDYIRRAMPFGTSQTLTNDELYAITAYVLFLNDIVTSDDFELSDKNFTTIKLPNEVNFFDDDREVTEKAFWTKAPCMTDCAPGPAQITGRARAIDVTPEGDTAARND